MATQKIEIITCDVCKGEINSPNHKSTHLSVVFTTEQTEGRSVKPYLTDKVIDICDGCLSQVLDGKMLFGSGAMGYNDYYFRKGQCGCS